MSTDRGGQYRGLDNHLHVTITQPQRAKLERIAKRTGVKVSALVRGMIDDLEVKK